MKKHIPNAITCCNLICGCIAIFYAMYGNYEQALWAIVAGAVFDFFDGMTARLLHVSSPIGKELDSLADVVTFGVAPSAMLFHLLMSCSIAIVIKGEGAAGLVEKAIFIMPFLAFIMAAFSALRLAKFNLDERQAMGFIGLPTPANALFWASIVAAWGVPLHNMLTLPMLIVVLTLAMFLSCYLLVAEIPMFALKFKTWGWKGNQLKWLFVISSALLIIGMSIKGMGLGAPALIIAWYIALSVANNKGTNK